MAGTLMSLLARFRTHERATRAYMELSRMATASPPELDMITSGYPWTVQIAYTEAQQPQVLAIVGRYGGVTFQE